MDTDRPEVSRRAAGSALLYAVPAAFLAVFFLYPVVRIVALGLAEGPWLSALLDVLSSGSLRGVLWFSLWQAAASTVLTLVVALPGAYVLARLRFPGKELLRAAITVPFVLPTVVVASAFVSLLGPRGLATGTMAAWFGADPAYLALTETIWAVLLAHVFFNYAVVVRTVGGLWSHLDPGMEDNARALGASRRRVLTEVTLPLLRPAIAAAAAIVFLFTFTSFGIVLILGGPGLATLEVEIYRYTAQLLDLPVASVLAIVQMVGVLAALVVYGRLRRRHDGRGSLASARTTSSAPRGWAERTFLGLNLSVMALLLGAPVAVLIERSLAVPRGYSLTFYQTLSERSREGILFVAPLEAVANSLVMAAGATIVAVLVGGAAAIAVTGGRGRGRLLDTILMLPLGTSAVTVGFGFLVAFGSAPLNLRSSPLLVPLAQALVATPFVIRILVPVLESIDGRLREAAATLGATPGRVWREVDLPLVFRAGLVAAGFAFAVSLGEFGATVFLAHTGGPTLPIAIFRLLGQPGAGSFGQAMAMSTILMLLTATVIMLIERVRVGRVGEF